MFWQDKKYLKDKILTRYASPELTVVLRSIIPVVKILTRYASPELTVVLRPIIPVDKIAASSIEDHFANMGRSYMLDKFCVLVNHTPGGKIVLRVCVRSYSEMNFLKAHYGLVVSMVMGAANMVDKEWAASGVVGRIHSVVTEVDHFFHHRPQ